MSHRSTRRQEKNRFLFGIWSDDIIKSGLEKTKPPVHKEAVHVFIFITTIEGHLFEPVDDLNKHQCHMHTNQYQILG